MTGKLIDALPVARKRAKLAVVLVAAATLGATSLGSTPASAEGAGTLNRADVARIAPSVNFLPSRCSKAKPTIISHGHQDWNSRIVAGKLVSSIGDDSTGTRRYLAPSKTVMWLKPASKVTLPSGMSQIGKAGTTVWQVPQTQNQNLIWLGWSTELLNAGNASGLVTWKLTKVYGPGWLKVYTIGSFGGVKEMVFNGAGTHKIPLGAHVHANWTFSKQGVYHLHFTQSVKLKNGKRSTDSEVLTIAVGNANPKTALRKGAGC